MRFCCEGSGGDLQVFHASVSPMDIGNCDSQRPHGSTSDQGGEAHPYSRDLSCLKKILHSPTLRLTI